MPLATRPNAGPKPPPQDPFTTEDGEPAPLPQVLKKLEIVTKRRVENLFAGAYQSTFLGQGMVFADVRPYQPGDEVRWIDWNVSARMNELYIKQFAEERERTVMLVWDASPSMDLGHRRRSKRELCAEVAMLLAMSAIHNGDRVGLILFADKVERYIAPQRGRKHVMRMIQEILQCKPSPQEQHQTAMTDALQFFHRVAPRHTIGFVLSDFLVPFAQSEDGLWQRLANKCDMIPLLLTDPLERRLPTTFATAEDAEPETADDDAIIEELGLPRSRVHKQRPPEPDETELAAQTSALDSPWLTVAIGVLCAVVGLWLGGAWQWTGLGALVLCSVVAWSLRSPQAGAICKLQDLESREPMAIDITDATTHKQLTHKAEEHQRQWLERFKRLQIQPVHLPTEEDYLSTLLRYFRMRR